jgi:hypothetical protein
MFGRAVAHMQTNIVRSAYLHPKSFKHIEYTCVYIYIHIYIYMCV